MHYIGTVQTNESPRNRIQLPAIGAEIFTYLKDVNDRESFTASRRLKDLLTSNLKIELVKSFPNFPVFETSQSTLRKITNSLLSAGASGHNRTLDAIQEFGDISNKENKEINYLEVAQYLRDWSKDYRSAKGSLDNSFKCINSFLRIQKTANDESIKTLLRGAISTYSDFLKWVNFTREYWIKKQIIKVNLQGSYLAIYDAFIETFDEDLSNKRFRSLLDTTWMRYLSLEHNPINVSETFDKDLDKPNPDSERRPSFDIELEIGSGKFEYLVRCYSFNQYQASQLQFKLALELSRAKQFPALNFRVSNRQDTSPTLVVAVKGVQNESDVSNIVDFIEDALQKAKFKH